MGRSINSLSVGKKYNAFNKCRNDYIHYEEQNITKMSQNLQGLKETGEELIMFRFKVGYVQEQLFVAVSVNFNKNGSFVSSIPS